MEYRKKLKRRLFVHLIWSVLGLGMILYCLLTDTNNTYPFTLGIAFIVIGVIRTIQYKQTVSDKEALRQKEIAESDERTRMIAERAKSWCFSLSLTAAGIWVIVQNLLGHHEEALPYAWYVCGMVLLYWICFTVIRKKY